MKVSHEVPIPYLNKSREFNDYCYCLPHLLDESEEYKDYFQKSKEMGRYIIMDNSLHELGQPYDSKRLWYWMNYFKPNEFIVVVQADCKSDAFECYQILKMQGYQKIAFSYGADWYYKEGLKSTPDPNNKFVTKAHGRYNTIKDFYQKRLIDKGDRVHLLGCNIPQEFSWYYDLPFIESIDTSNPVIHGLAGVKYEEYGLEDKLPHKVDKFEGNSENWDLVLYNVKKFKEFIPQKNKEYAN